MKTWQDLSPEQQVFLKKFLKTGILDIVRDKYKTDTNKGIIAAFGQFADLDALFVERAALVPDDYPEKAGPMGQAETARQRKEAGAFEDATKRMAPAIQAMEQLRVTLTADADALRADVAPVMGVGFADGDIAAMDQARQAVLQHLTDPLPTHTQMEQARSALPAYHSAINAAYAAAGELPAARAVFAKVAAAANARLDAVANMDTAVFSATPQAGGLAAAVQEAKDLQTAIANVDQDDAAALRTLTSTLEEWTIRDTAQTLVEDARLAVIAQVQAIYDDAKEDIDDAVDLDPTEYDGEPEEAALKKTHGELVAERQSHLAVIASGDPVEVLKLIPLIAATESKAQDFYDLTIDIDVRREKARYQSLGASGAHAEGIAKLLEDNDAAGTKVVESLQRNSVILGGAEATRDYIENKDTEVKQLAGELKTLEEEWVVLNQDFQTKLADFNTKNDAYAQEKQRVVLLGTAATDQDRAAVETARLALEASRQIALPAQTLKNDKADDWKAKKVDVDAANKQLNAAKSQRAMLDAVTFGPLSPMAPHPIPDAMLEDVVELFDKNVGLATKTCALIRDAKDPTALAETAVFMADQCATKFAWQPPAGSDGVVPPAKEMSEDYAQQYAEAALVQAAYFGADFTADAQVAIANGVQFNENDRMRALTDFSMKNVAATRATQAAEAMIKRTSTGVKIDLDSAGFNAMLMDRQHGYDASYQPTITLTEQVLNLRDFFEDPTDGDARKAEAEAILNSVNAVPSSPAARTLLSTQMGIPAGDFDDPAKADEIKEKIQVGILKAMSTPIAQGSVGSCFATAPLRKLQNEDPIALMEMYRDIATKGTFTPKHGRPVAAVTRLPAGDEPLARSLEYSIATAAARTKNSRERQHMNAVMFDPSEPSLGALQGEVDANAWLKLLPELQRYIAGGYTFVYDPTSAAGAVSADGSSSMGVYKMVALDTKDEITSQSEFVAFVKRNALVAIQKAGLPDTDRDKVTAYIDDPAFIAGIDKLAGNDKPWQMQFGGWGDASGAVLFEEADGTKKPENFRGSNVVNTNPTDTTGDRAVKVVKALSGLSGGEMTMVSTGGIHAFNALEPTGDYAALNDPPGFDQNIKDLMIDPGKKMATDKLPADRAAYLYGKRIDAVLPWAADDAERDLIKAAHATPPSVDMTPAELEAYISTKLDPWKTASVNRKANEWTANQTPLPAPSEVTKKKADLLAAENASQKNRMAGMMAAELGAPEFVIADSNWGSERDKTLFVIAPDPLTGEPRMWQKSAVNGGLYPMDNKWLDTNWVKDE